MKCQLISESAHVCCQ